MSGQGKDTAPQDKYATAFEQHALTVIGVVIAALLLWVGNTVALTQVKVGEVGKTVEIMSARILTLEETLNEFRRDYVRRIDYDRDQDRIEARFDDVESSVSTRADRG